MRILFIGDIFARPGRIALENKLTQIKSEHNIDVCIANGENAAGGKGLTFDVMHQILDLGVDIITLGNHAWDNKNIFTFIDDETRLIRPFNYPPNTPGLGFITLTLENGIKIAVTQLMGRLFMQPLDCPFQAADYLADELKDNHIKILDFHAEATSEKQAMGWFVDGRFSAVLGTHTHVPTADERILPNGTAYISDVGMTGSYDSIIGMDKESATNQFLTGIKNPYKISKENVKIAAVVIDIDEDTGKSRSITRILEPVK